MTFKIYMSNYYYQRSSFCSKLSIYFAYDLERDKFRRFLQAIFQFELLLQCIVKQLNNLNFFIFRFYVSALTHMFSQPAIAVSITIHYFYYPEKLKPLVRDLFTSDLYFNVCVILILFFRRFQIQVIYLFVVSYTFKRLKLYIVGL